ncbi:MAG: efflux RND transporter periplasmic adaptor subunit [Desulfotomaculaceae bacterium]|nr:efflux RND transporter periplasmic adaptor subunit [Desulfotomaculaceae bacterium]
MAKKKKIGWVRILAGFLALVLVLLGVGTVYLKKNTVDYYRLKPLDINQTVLASGRVSFPQPYEITAVSSGKISQYNQAVLTRDSLAGGSGAAEVEAQIAYYETQLLIAQKAVEDKRIISPVTGTVSKVNFSPDQQAPAGATLLTVLRQQNWVVEADVDQKELSHLEPGQPALVAFDAYPREKLEAELLYISPQIDEQKGTCLLRLEIKEAKPFIRHGMAASVELLSEPHKQVLALPKQFVDFTEKEAFLWVLKDGKAVKTPVTYISVGERWVIAENLSEGTVVLSPAKKPGGFKVHLGREVLPDEV